MIVEQALADSWNGTIVLDRAFGDELRQRRAENGSDRWDEVWEGVYVMSPLPNLLHQRIVLKLARIFEEFISESGHGKVYAGMNVSDRQVNWEKNYRIPDVAVVLNDTTAEDRDTHLFGGPNFVVEVVSKNDLSREKLDFYAKVGTHEALFVDRQPWRLEIFRLIEEKLVSVGVSTIDENQTLESAVIPFTFRLVAGKDRPRIEVSHTENSQSWLV